MQERIPNKGIVMNFYRQTVEEILDLIVGKSMAIDWDVFDNRQLGDLLLSDVKELVKRLKKQDDSVDSLNSDIPEVDREDA
jgi:hypothetical protein